MDNSAGSRCGEIGAGFDDGGEGVIGGLQAGGGHAAVVNDGVGWAAVFGGCGDEGVKEKGVRLGDGEEEGAGIGGGGTAGGGGGAEDESKKLG